MDTAIAMTTVEFEQPFMVGILGGKNENEQPKIIDIEEAANSRTPSGYPKILMPPQEKCCIKPNRYDFF